MFGGQVCRAHAWLCARSVVSHGANPLRCLHSVTSVGQLASSLNRVALKRNLLSNGEKGLSPFHGKSYFSGSVNRLISPNLETQNAFSSHGRGQSHRCYSKERAVQVESFRNQEEEDVVTRMVADGLESEEETRFVLNVFTADRRGAGTTGNIVLQVTGTEGVSGEYILSGKFHRGTANQFFLDGMTNLGKIEMVEVWQDSSSFKDRWLLDKLIITTPEDKILQFDYNKWIGLPEDGIDPDDFDPITAKVQLYPVEKDDVNEIKEIAPRWWQPVKMITGCAAVPSAEKLRLGAKSVIRQNNGYAGEDSYFVYSTNEEINDENPISCVMGVADGVGMWKKEGVDAGKYSRHLMHSARAAVTEANLRSPFKILSDAYQKTTLVDRMKGSCTACIMALDSMNASIEAVNIGDSGIIVIRGSSVVFRSPEQEHFFGCPYQLGHNSSTLPDQAQRVYIDVEPGDVILLASDGLFDNVSDRMIASLVSKYTSPIMFDHITGMQIPMQHTTRKINVTEMARMLAGHAYYNSINKEKDTPWSLAASQEWDMPINGGKVDDIVVVVGYVEVIENEKSKEHEEGAPS